MKRILFTFVAMFVASCAAAEYKLSIELPSPVETLVGSDEAFLPFATRVREEVTRLFGVPEAVDDPETLQLLLSTRVHLAHHFSDNEAAIATAAWIRSRQTDASNRAFAGLTTLAAVEARLACPGAKAGEPAYRVAFHAAFQAKLAKLPRDAGIVEMLRGQREKIEGITEENLMREAREVIAPALKHRGYCGLREADLIVRVRHRIESIVPVREETLRALDSAIAERIQP